MENRNDTSDYFDDFRCGHCGMSHEGCRCGEDEGNRSKTSAGLSAASPQPQAASGFSATIPHAPAHKPGEILVWLDGPQVFTTHDDEGGLYLTTHLRSDSAGENHCIASKLDEDQLLRFKHGKVDLLTTILDARAWYFLAYTGGDLQVYCEITEPPAWCLPGDGFFLASAGVVAAEGGSASSQTEPTDHATARSAGTPQ